LQGRPGEQDDTGESRSSKNQPTSDFNASNLPFSAEQEERKECQASQREPDPVERERPDVLHPGSLGHEGKTPDARCDQEKNLVPEPVGHGVSGKIPVLLFIPA
jgi:hypothetical protein